MFKLEEVDRREKLLKPGAICLDLGAAPGACSQYACRRLGCGGGGRGDGHPADEPARGPTCRSCPSIWQPRS
ncbi:MAG: SAM-dependent methyltransferase [Steroidobacteraceae bacterium]